MIRQEHDLVLVAHTSLASIAIMDGGEVCKIRYLSIFTPCGMAEEARGRLQGCGKTKEGVSSRTRSPALTLVQEHKVHAIHAFIACRTRPQREASQHLGCSARGYCRASHTACGSTQLGQGPCTRSTSTACMYVVPECTYTQYACLASSWHWKLEPFCHCIASKPPPPVHSRCLGSTHGRVLQSI